MTYRDQFAKGNAAARYDAVQYGDGSYSALLWEVEKVQLDSILARHAPRDFSYLDFACGTGRVLEHVAPQAASSVGIEISAAMADRARDRVPDATVIVKDVTGEGAEIEGTYDVITAFRFVLNAESSLRSAGLRALRARLANEDSILVFNNHGNLASHKAVMALPHLLRRRGHTAVEGNVLRDKSVRALAAQAGLRVDRVAGAGLLGGRLAAKISVGRVRRIEQRFARSRITRLGSNQLYLARRVN